MSIADKLITIADNTPAVAEAVNSSKSTVSGTVIRIDDVLNTGHALTVQTEPGATVSVYGKNLFNQYAEQYSGSACSSAIVNDELVITTTARGQYISANFVIPNGETLVGKQVTVKGDWITSGANVGCLRVGWTAADDVGLMVGAIGGNKYSGTAKTYTISAKPDNAGELCLWIYGNYDGTGATGATVSYRNIQIEVGAAATGYEVFNGIQTATADADGKVSDLMSVAPSMTVIADDVVECTFFSTSAAGTYEKYQQLKMAEVALIELLRDGLAL